MDKVIRFSFYLLFFLVPLFFSANTSELFEYNKMMLTYGITIVIVAAWIIKMIQQNRIIYKRTLLEIPLLLYLGSHFLSTIFSLDPHTSIWGYYSRFHEGLLSSFCYILLYFAAVSNITKEDVKKIFYSSFASAAIIAIWGAMEHFGNSPSCMIITGKAGVDCWIQDVQNRVYATLGQPNWMAAYLCVQIILALEFVRQFEIRNLKFKILYFLPALLFAALLFTKSRSGIVGLGAGLGVYGLLNFKQLFNKSLLILLALLVLLALFFGVPFPQTEKFSLEKLFNQQPATSNQQPVPNPEILISESGDIRKVVWTGALKVWQRYPILGSGVETFAFAYYKDRPVEHNLLSEWDFLYNKAHNEYLNVLATTGTVGMIAYLSITITFIVWSIYNLKFKILIQTSNFKFQISLLAAYISILVTNFFGFSVVIIGIYFFLIPAFYEILSS